MSEWGSIEGVCLNVEAGLTGIEPGAVSRWI